MPLFTFLLGAVLISLSGVLSPGPITAVAVGKGSESPHAGALVALGHGIVEIPLMVCILFGLGYLLNLAYVNVGIALVGGLFLLVMGVCMFRSINRLDVSSTPYNYSPMTAGILLTIGNPYFLVWWATVGATLISRSLSFGLVAFVVFALLHWACDLLWCYFLSTVSFKGGRFFGKRFQKTVFAICGGMLLFFGGKFILDAVKLLS